MDFNVILRDLRTKKGLSQDEIAKILDVPRTTYAKWEGTIRPEFEMLVKISRYYGVTCDYLLTGESKQDIHTETDTMLMTTDGNTFKLLNVTNDKQLQDLINKFPKLTPSGKSAVMRFLTMTLEDEQEQAATSEEKHA